MHWFVGSSWNSFITWQIHIFSLGRFTYVMLLHKHRKYFDFVMSHLAKKKSLTLWIILVTSQQIFWFCKLVTLQLNIFSLWCYKIDGNFRKTKVQYTWKFLILRCMGHGKCRDKKHVQFCNNTWQFGLMKHFCILVWWPIAILGHVHVPNITTIAMSHPHFLLEQNSYSCHLSREFFPCYFSMCKWYCWQIHMVKFQKKHMVS